MIRVSRPGVFEAGLSSLSRFASHNDVRGRFVAMYLGLRRMGDAIASLGSLETTPAAEIQRFLDQMFSKNHRPAPLVVLTDLFGQSTSLSAPWSTRTGERSPNNQYPTNTWRNNFGIQKGVGCPADANTIIQVLSNPVLRLSCPWMSTDDEGRQACGIAGTNYRGEEHSIWLRLSGEGYQVVNLNHPAVYQSYLLSGATVPIPLFGLISALYCYAPPGVYPAREIVGIPEFAQDFGFSTDQVQEIFDAEPDSPGNADVVAISSGGPIPVLVPVVTPTLTVRPLPALPDPVELNTGVGAEIAVAHDLERSTWIVSYVANVRSLGYDLEATQGNQTLRIEVKSSVGLCRPEMTEEEWRAAQRFGDSHVLAIVDYFGCPGQRISYVRNPAVNAFPTERQTAVFAISRQEISALAVEAEFL
jgi:hypothetical protein